MKRILYVHSRKASFVAIDREILAERYEVEDYYQPGRWPHPLRQPPRNPKSTGKLPRRRRRASCTPCARFPRLAPP